MLAVGVLGFEPRIDAPKAPVLPDYTIPRNVDLSRSSEPCIRLHKYRLSFIYWQLRVPVHLHRLYPSLWYIGQTGCER